MAEEWRLLAESQTNEDDRKKLILQSLVEGQKMDAYAEGRTKEMKICWICETICYRRKPVKSLGSKWICIDCLRSMKELLDTLGQWEEELALKEEMKKQLGQDLNVT